jgi:hypothetical protein
MRDPADATTPTAPAATTPPTNARAWPRRLLLAGRILVTLGAVGFAVSCWTWWWQVDGYTAAGISGPLLNYVLLLTPGDLVPAFGTEFYSHALTLAMLLPLPFLWLARSALPKRLAASITFLLAFAFILQATLPSGVFHTGGTIQLVDGLTPQQLTIDGSIHDQLGWTLNHVFFIILFLALLVAIIFSEVPTPARSRASAPQPPSHPRLTRLPAAGALTLGLILFLIAILGMGWTAVNCTERPLFFGQCTGLTFPGVLHYGIASQTDAFDPIASLYAIPALLVGGAILALVGLWCWRRLTPGLALWLTLYLAAATPRSR